MAGSGESACCPGRALLLIQRIHTTVGLGAQMQACTHIHQHHLSPSYMPSHTAYILVCASGHIPDAIQACAHPHQLNASHLPGHTTCTLTLGFMPSPIAHMQHTNTCTLTPTRPLQYCRASQGFTLCVMPSPMTLFMTPRDTPAPNSTPPKQPSQTNKQTNKQTAVTLRVMPSPMALFMSLLRLGSTLMGGYTCLLCSCRSM
jgi:hypothetical protein